MNEIVGYVISFLGGGGIVAFLIIWGLRNLDKVEVLGAWFYRTFCWAFRKWEYNRAATDVQAAVNTVGEAVNREAEDALPHAMKIEYAKTTQDAEAFLRDGKIIVTMGHSPDRDRNLVVSTIAYLSKGLLPRVRPYVDNVLMRATDFAVAKRIFASTGRSTVVSFFFQNYLEPEIQVEPQLQRDCTLLDGLERVGFFSRIFLKQLTYLGDKVFPATPDDFTQQETRDFAEFLTNIAAKERGEDVAGGLTFGRSRIRVSVMLVAREKTRMWGAEPYVRRTKINLDAGIENMYICARGAENISLAEQVASEQETVGRLRVITRHRFSQTIDGERINAVCIVCALNLMVPSRAVSEPSAVLYQLLEEHVEELRGGLLEVVAIARHLGVKSKIAVRPLADGIDAVACCTRAAELEATRAVLGDEPIEVMEWHNEPESMIVASLTPLNPNDVVEVSIDTEKKQCIVKVKGWKAKRKALGRGDQNVKCAMELTGWQIAVEQASTSGEEPVT